MTKYLSFAMICCLMLAACRKADSPITGIWKVDYYEVNGTVIGGQNLGNPLWEFNREGGYLINASGVEERGTYKFDEQVLRLHPISVKKPDAEFRVTLLDSIQMEYSSTDTLNRMKARLVKLKHTPERD